MSKIDFGRKQAQVKEKRDNRPNEYRQLRYTKLLGEVVKRIIANNSKILKKNDLSEICIKVYGKTNKIKEIRVRKMLEAPAVKSDINNALIAFYSSAGLDKQEAIRLLNLTKSIAEDKKDGNLLLKLVDKYENAANLTQKAGITARTTETTDFSRIGKDGQPAQKVVKTLEVTTNSDNLANEAVNGSIREATSDDNGQGSDNV